jgi:phosphotransferase system enzyme I (PtsP)
MLDVLRRIIQEVNAARDLQSALNIIVARVAKAMGTQVCSVYLLDDTRERYIFMATEGLNEAAVSHVSIDLDKGLVGLVGERAEPVNLDNAQKHPRYLHIDEVGEEPYHSFLGVPIIHHRTVLGVLVVQQQEARRYDESEEAFLITLSAQLAGVIAHAKATGAILDVLELDENTPSTTVKAAPGAPGIAIGTAYVCFPQADLNTVPERKVDDTDGEKKKFRSALVATRKEIRSLSRKLTGRLPKEELALFDAYLHMLDDNAIGGEVIGKIKQGFWSQTALRLVIDKHIEAFEVMEDSYIKERASDVRDLGQRVLANLQLSEGTRRDFPENTILVGSELSPSMIAEVPEEKLAGIVSVQGSANSHVAILARAMGLPTVMGAVDLPISLLDGQPMIADGFEGQVICNPGKEEYEAYRKVVQEEEAFGEGLEELKDLPTETPDGHVMTLYVNTGLVADVARSLDRGAQGVGLYRTEVHFQMIDRFPTEEEQRVIYRDHMKAFSPLPVTMRTLDIGGDKALSYFPIQEENPFLGWRGIRVTLDHPEIFLAQVRAMIRAHEGLDGELNIMLPMISSVSEVDEALRLIGQCYREIIEEGVEVEMPDVGVMVEVPAAVYQAGAIIKRVDFLSVGSNDLTQYMLAVDRNNAQVAGLYQHLHPAVLHALKDVVDATKAAKKPVSICGEMAGNPGAAILLMAMGYDVLSMSATSLPIIKWVLRSVNLEDARTMLKKVLKMDNAWVIRNYMDDQLRKAGLGQLLR